MPSLTWLAHRTVKLRRLLGTKRHDHTRPILIASSTRPRKRPARLRLITSMIASPADRSRSSRAVCTASRMLPQIGGLATGRGRRRHRRDPRVEPRRPLPAGDPAKARVAVLDGGGQLLRRDRAGLSGLARGHSVRRGRGDARPGVAARRWPLPRLRTMRLALRSTRRREKTLSAAR
jgi:hypothetical protein